MKLNINKVSDLSSISVLPPHSRRLNAMNSGVDAYGLGRNQASQLRSQSQQSFSQGLSQSQISQSSFENLGSGQKIDSQEREKSSKRISSLAPIMPLREDSQMQLSGTSSNAMRRWSCATAPDNKCHVSEELEHRLRLLESSLNKVGMILDSLQSDVMQVNRAVKEVSLEMEGIRQKANLLDSSTQQVLREEEDIKARLDRSMKIISDEMLKKADLNRLDETAYSIPSFTKEIEAQLLGFQSEICFIISKNMEVLTKNMKSVFNNLPDAILSSEAKSFITTRRHEGNQKSKIEMFSIKMLTERDCKPVEIMVMFIWPVYSSFRHMRREAVLKKEESLKVLTPKMTNSSKYAIVKHEEIPMPLQEQILIESDEECDRSPCCILLKKETGVLSKECQLEKEAIEESMRILMKARKRKRRPSTYMNLV